MLDTLYARATRWLCVPHLERRVALRMKIVDPRTGTTLWQHMDQEGSVQQTRNPVTAAVEYAKGMGKQLTESLLSSPLYPETDRLVQRLMQELPAYDVSGHS